MDNDEDFSEDMEMSDEEIKEMGFASREDYEEYQKLTDEDRDPYLAVQRENCRGL